MLARASSRTKEAVRKVAAQVDPAELEHPTFLTVLKYVWRTISSLFSERPGQVIGSTFLLVMVWGTHGKLELLGAVWPDWQGPGTDPATRVQILPGVPWDHELVAFLAGLLLLVLIPIAIIKLVFKEPLSSYGLGLPPKDRRKMAILAFLLLVGLSLPGFAVAVFDPTMREVYPFFRDIASPMEFVLYQISYFTFFLAIEFIFRGYLLFGIAGMRDEEVPGGGRGLPGRLYFAKYAILVQMLSYTAWHLGKPLPELWGTLPWGLATGAVAYATRSIWPIVLAHWLLNVFLDAAILLT